MYVIVKEEEPSQSAMWGQMSWRRLAEEVMVRSGELLPGEEVVSFEVTDEWIKFKTRPKK